MKTSVALCTYNGELFLSEQLQSILEQSIAVDEIIICDDGSTDNTISIIDSFINQGALIQLFKNPMNLGGKKNFEQAVSNCTGDVIFLSDQDDIWMPNKVERTVETFKSNADVQGLFHDALLMATSEVAAEKTLWQALNFSGTEGFKNVNCLFKAQLFYRNFVTGACLSFRKEALDAILPFQLLGSMWHDEWIALKLSSLNQLGCIGDTLVHYRNHAGQQTKLPAEVLNRDLDAVYKAIYKGDYDAFPLYTYIHFHRRILFAKVVQQAIDIDQKLANEMQSIKRNALRQYFSQFTFFTRKIELVKWIVKGKEDITFKDLVTL